MASPNDRVPIVAIFGVTAAIGLMILRAGRKRAEASPVTEDPLRMAESEKGVLSEEIGAAEAGGCQMGLC